MKLIVMSMLLMASFSFACPNLAGSYRCYDENGQEEITHVTQRNVNGFMAYSINGDDGLYEVIADNQTRKVDFGDASMGESKLKAYCSGGKLFVDMTSEVFDQGQKIGSAKVSMNVSLENNNLRSTQSGQINTEYGDFPIPETTDVCARI